MFKPNALQWRILETLQLGALKGFPLADRRTGELQPNCHLQCRNGVPLILVKAALLPSRKGGEGSGFDTELKDVLNELEQRKLVTKGTRKIPKAHHFVFQRSDGLAVFIREVCGESGGTVDATVGRIRGGKISGGATTMWHTDGKEPTYKLEPSGFELLDSRVDDGAAEAEAAESGRPGDRYNMPKKRTSKSRQTTEPTLAERGCPIAS